jgi:hypothetical protein
VETQTLVHPDRNRHSSSHQSFQNNNAGSIYVQMARILGVCSLVSHAYYVLCGNFRFMGFLE